ncbi:MAG: rRNA maturation RNase YbeY [Nitrospirota bacterium]|jgi:probable rRNA maturation factor
MKVTISNRQRKVKLNRRQIERDALKALDLMGFEGAELSLLFVNGERMRALNKEYRRVDADTDVLSFPLFDSYKQFPPAEEFLMGDIVINPQRAGEQAKEAGHSLRKELRVLLAHGLVHLMGMDHEKGGYEGKKMRLMEKRLLSGLEG